MRRRSAKLESDAPVDADGLEAERLVQPDARRVRQRDAGVDVHEVLSSQEVEQGEVERAADTAPMELAIDIDRHVHAPLVGLAGPMGRRVGVRNNRAIRLEYEPRIALALRLDSAPELCEIGQDGFERGSVIRHERRVDCLDGPRVGEFHAPDCCVHDAAPFEGGLATPG